MQRIKIKFPKESKKNAALCDAAFLLFAEGNWIDAHKKYAEASENGSARGAFMCGFINYRAAYDEKQEEDGDIWFFGRSARADFEKALDRKYPIAAGFLTELLAGSNELSEPDYPAAERYMRMGCDKNDPVALYCAVEALDDNLNENIFTKEPYTPNENQVIENGKRCASCAEPFYKSNSKCVFDLELYGIGVHFLITCAAHTAAVAMMFHDKLRPAQKAEMTEYAAFASQHGNEKSSLLLAKCCAEGKITARNITTARTYLQRACEQGTDLAGNLFIQVKEIVEKAEVEQAKIDAAKGRMRTQAAHRFGYDRALAVLSFTEWFSDFVEKATSAPPPPEQVSGNVRPEMTATGIEYRFYANDDPTRAVRLKTFDPVSGTGETQDGQKVQRN